MKKKRMQLCLPCALALEKTAPVKRLTFHKDRKVTCRMCGRARFGADYEVGGKEKRNE